MQHIVTPPSTFTLTVLVNRVSIVIETPPNQMEHLQTFKLSDVEHLFKVTLIIETPPNQMQHLQTLNVSDVA